MTTTKKSLSATSVDLPEDARDQSEDVEVYIFEAPDDFDISILEGKKIYLLDGQIVEQSNSSFSRQLIVDNFTTIANKTERIVVPRGADSDKWQYVSPAGRISVVDCLDNVETDVPPSTIPAKCPKLPTGLRARYQPFGSIRKGSLKSFKKSPTRKIKSKISKRH